MRRESQLAGTYSQIVIHVVFSTKDREAWIDSVWADHLYGYIGGIVRDEGGMLLAAGGVADHVHLLIGLKPDVAMSDMMREVKSRSSKWVHAEFEKRFAWQEGYAAFSVSASMVDVVRGYIARQEERHRKSDFKSELLEFLRAHGVEFDERYVF